MMNFKFKDGSLLNIDGYEGSFTDKDLREHFGSEIADRINEESTGNILHCLGYNEKH